MKGLVFVLVALLLSFAAYAATAPHDIRSGVWTAEVLDEGKLNMSVFTGRSDMHWGNNISGFTLPLARFEGLSAADGPSKFVLHAPAGTIAFDGHFDALKGAGHFTFTPNDSFVRDMESLGYHDFRDDELLTFTTTDFSADALRGLRSMGYDISRKELDEIAVFHITPAVIREYAQAGYPNLAMRDVLEFRVGRITAKKIDEYRSLGYDHLTARQLSEMGIMNVTADYIRQMQAIGVTDLHKLIELKAMGASDILLKKKKN